MRPSSRTVLSSLIAGLLAGLAPVAGAERGASGAVAIPGGTFATVLVIDEPQVEVRPFLMAPTPVTNAEFLAFVEEQPRWRRSAVPSLFAAPGYLRHWSDDTVLGGHPAAASEIPVTNVSWFAAASYCSWAGGRLPTEHEWEYVAGQGVRGDDALAAQHFAWYSNPRASLRPVGQTDPNPFGIHDLHGMVLEWVEDYQRVLPASDDGSPFGLACGAAARLLAGNTLSDQLSLMRHVVRMSFSAEGGTGTLGFRCAWDAAAELAEPTARR